MAGVLNDKKPIFEQIKDWISDQIIDGTLKAHDRIPSTNEIVQFYKVNHLTVAKASISSSMKGSSIRSGGSACSSPRRQGTYCSTAGRNASLPNTCAR